MRLSIIIVSYNVRDFLEKCLVSVYQAILEIDAEIFVVDNNSLDDSVDIVKSKYPGVKLIVNDKNVGFAAANNIALKQAKGEYVLLLNPDTVVSEDTFHRCLTFMDEHQDAAAVGVSMLDGTGAWLPESKRGLPSPMSSFFKLTGINALFPKSNFFNGYYLGGLDPSETHRVDVLTGAFMFIRKSVLENIGYLDEDYFMYGEDIDLSYRILKAGFYNYYLPTTSIIHYKGESTKRSSLEYVKTFYRAMLIFVRKNYPGPRGFIIAEILRLGILLRALLSGLVRFTNKVLVPLIDIVLIAGVILGVKMAWARWYFGDPDHFDLGFLKVNLPLYTMLWMSSLFLFGVYDTRRTTGRVVGAVLSGTIAVLLAYALLSLPYRSSRAVILISAAVLTVVLSVWGMLLWSIRRSVGPRRIVVVGSSDESARIMELLNRINAQVEIAGGVSVAGMPLATDHLGHVDVLNKIVDAHRIDEVIFSSEDLPFSDISKWMSRLSPKVRFKIASSHSDAIIGSDSKKLAGDFYAFEIQFAIASGLQRRNKRLFDVALALIILASAPLTVIFRYLRQYVHSATRVLKGSHTWVSYSVNDTRINELPVLKPGIYTPGGLGEGVALSAQERHMINYLYARQYRVWRDLEIMFRRGTKLRG